MDVSVITQLISNLGFPIFVAVWMLWDKSKSQAEMKEILINNTAAIEKLSDRLDAKEDGLL